MKQPFLIVTFILCAFTVCLNAQTGYKIHNCKSGHCSVLRFPNQASAPQKSVLSTWTEPIRISVGVQEGVILSNDQIEAQIAEDSQIAIDDGLYTGSGPAYILSNVFSFSPDELLDEGFPFIVASVSAAFSSIDFSGSGPQLGTIYDNQVLENRNCLGTHITYAVVDNATPGIQELATINVNPTADANPTITFKRDAFLIENVRNHGISHAAGGNSGDHQDGPEISRRPIMRPDGTVTYGWSNVGGGGFSGGNSTNGGPEDLAGHVADGFATWLDLIPNLGASLTSAPTELELGETGSFSASINKDIGNENWSWAFTNGGDTFSESGSDISVTFATAGTWTYEVVVSNDCGGQTDTLTGSVTVNTAMQQAPSASCQSLTLALNSNGMASVSAADINNGSSDSDGSIVSMTINGQSELNFGCSNLGTQDITLMVTDNDGLSATCQTTISVVDETAPLITANDISLVLDDNGVASLDFSDVAAVSDNCTVDNSDLSQSTFDCNDIGNQQISLTASDASGNTSTETITVSVADETSPTLICAEDITLSLQADETVLLTAEEFYTSVTDACGEPTITVSQLEFSGDTPGAFDVELIATDPSGNSETCLVNVTVDIVSSTINIDQDQRINVYPNPTSDMLYLEIDGALSVNDVILTDVTGRKFEAPFAQQISVTQLAPGIFILEVITENEVFVKKIMKW